MWKKIAYALASIGSLIMFAAGVGPKDAASNLAQWYELVTHLSPPHWLAVKQADQIAINIAIGILVAAAFSGFHALSLSRIKKAAASTNGQSKTDPPLQIIFDTSNPNRRFWSLGSMKNPNDLQGGHIAYKECRVEIKNTSPETARNVRVSVEHIGENLPRRPEWASFDRDVTDIQPGCSELAPVVRWFTNIMPGTLCGESAWEYGPLKVVVSADNMMPSTKMFQFNWQIDQMLFDEHDFNKYMRNLEVEKQPVVAYMSAYEALHYLADESGWGKTTANEETKNETENGMMTLRKNVLLESPFEFSKRASEGKIKVYGYLTSKGEHVLIPASYWMAHAINISTIRDDTNGMTMPATYTSVVTSNGNQKIYSDLRINAEDVYKTWPKPPVAATSGH